MRALIALALAGTVTGAAQARDDLARSVFGRFGLDPAPQIVRAEDFSGGLTRDEWARSIVYDSGREVIVLSEGARDRGRVEQMLEHEAAHLRAWRDHGHGIKMHGREWRRICRKYARLKHEACTPDH